MVAARLVTLLFSALVASASAVALKKNRLGKRQLLHARNDFNVDALSDVAVGKNTQEEKENKALDKVKEKQMNYIFVNSEDEDDGDEEFNPDADEFNKDRYKFNDRLLLKPPVDSESSEGEPEKPLTRTMIDTTEIAEAQQDSGAILEMLTDPAVRALVEQYRFSGESIADLFTQVSIGTMFDINEDIKEQYGGYAGDTLGGVYNAYLETIMKSETLLDNVELELNSIPEGVFQQEFMNDVFKKIHTDFSKTVMDQSGLLTEFPDIIAAVEAKAKYIADDPKFVEDVREAAELISESIVDLEGDKDYNSLRSSASGSEGADLDNGPVIAEVVAIANNDALTEEGKRQSANGMVRMSMQVGDNSLEDNFVNGDAGRESITDSLDRNADTFEEIKTSIEVEEEEKEEEEEKAEK